MSQIKNPEWFYRVVLTFRMPELNGPGTKEKIETYYFRAKDNVVIEDNGGERVITNEQTVMQVRTGYEIAGVGTRELHGEIPSGFKIVRVSVSPITSDLSENLAKLITKE